ncbi:MAG: hypothetical protein CVV53_06910, partial [Spirochaetae bacterium HGW-Spirochaetae-9]
MNKVLPRIAIRNLSRQKKRTFLLGGAIAFGIMIVTLINGFAGAFIENVSENFAYLMAGHVFVQGTEKTDSGKRLYAIRDDSVILKALQDAGVSYEFATKSSEVSASLVFAGKSINQNLTGLDISNSTFLKERLVLRQGSWEAAAAADALIISEKIATKLNILPGDRVTAQFQTITGQNNIADFTIAAISQDSSIIGSVMAYVNLPYLNEVIGLKPGEYMSLGFMLANLKDAKEFSAYPTHCVGDTEESDLVDTLAALEAQGLITIHKNSTNGILAHNPAAIDLNLSNFLVIGCVTDICVYQYAVTLRAYLNEHQLDGEV